MKSHETATDAHITRATLAAQGAASHWRAGRTGSVWTDSALLQRAIAAPV